MCFFWWQSEALKAKLMTGTRRNERRQQTNAEAAFEEPILLWTTPQESGMKSCRETFRACSPSPQSVLSRSGLSGTIETAPTERTPCRLSVQTFRRSQREKSMGLLLMSLEDAVSCRPNAFLQDPRRLALQRPTGARRVRWWMFLRDCNSIFLQTGQ